MIVEAKIALAIGAVLLLMRNGSASESGSSESTISGAPVSGVTKLSGATVGKTTGGIPGEDRFKAGGAGLAANNPSDANDHGQVGTQGLGVSPGSSGVSGISFGGISKAGGDFLQSVAVGVAGIFGGPLAGVVANASINYGKASYSESVPVSDAVVLEVNAVPAAAPNAISITDFDGGTTLGGSSQGLSPDGTLSGTDTFGGGSFVDSGSGIGGVGRTGGFGFDANPASEFGGWSSDSSSFGPDGPNDGGDANDSSGGGGFQGGNQGGDASGGGMAGSDGGIGGY